jgi:hypothetical protein
MRFEYEVIESPFDFVGRPALPPGKVTVNVEPGATAVGAMIPMLMSCVCVRIVPLTLAVHATFGNVCVNSWSSAAAGVAFDTCARIARLKAARPP